MEHVETVIVGAGQAGLATAYHLKRRGRECVVLDDNQRVGDNWRRQWDSLRLYSPARYDGLPGMAFPAAQWSFPSKDEVADYLEAVRPHGATCRSGSASRVDGSPATATATSSPPTRARSTATTWSSRPAPSVGRRSVPDFAADLDPAILQLHSSEYRRPGQLRDGPVLVVGASHSGTRHRLRGRRDPADDPGRT